MGGRLSWHLCGITVNTVRGGVGMLIGPRALKTLKTIEKIPPYTSGYIRHPNDEYENFVNAHIEAAAECIPTKIRKKCKVPWEILAVQKNLTT